MPGIVPNEAGLGTSPARPNAAGPLAFRVYILRSRSDPSRTYVGFTELTISQRLAKHNEGGVPSTAPYRPWHPVFACALPDKHRALDFERYLKSHSGKAFAAKHLL